MANHESYFRDSAFRQRRSQDLFLEPRERSWKRGCAIAKISLLLPSPHSDNAYACDPRIKKFKDEEKERKLAEKKAKKEAARLAAEEKERVSFLHRRCNKSDNRLAVSQTAFLIPITGISFWELLMRSRACSVLRNKSLFSQILFECFFFL